MEISEDAGEEKKLDEGQFIGPVILECRINKGNTTPLCKSTKYIVVVRGRGLPVFVSKNSHCVI